MPFPQTKPPFIYLFIYLFIFYLILFYSTPYFILFDFIECFSYSLIYFTYFLHSDASPALLPFLLSLPRRIATSSRPTHPPLLISHFTSRYYGSPLLFFFWAPVVLSFSLIPPQTLAIPCKTTPD